MVLAVTRIYCPSGNMGDISKFYSAFDYTHMPVNDIYPLYNAEFYNFNIINMNKSARGSEKL